MGGMVRDVADYYCATPFNLPLPNRLVTPWKMQAGRPLVNGSMDRGSFDDPMHAEWENNVQEQEQFAKVFCVPWRQSMEMRAVATDIADVGVHPTQQRSQASSEIMHFIRSTHRQTELDLINGKFISNVYLGLQQTSRELQLAMHGGPFGGLLGKTNDMLFKIRHDSEVNNVDEDILFLITSAPTRNDPKTTVCQAARARCPRRK